MTGEPSKWSLPKEERLNDGRTIQSAVEELSVEERKESVSQLKRRLHDRLSADTPRPRVLVLR